MMASADGSLVLTNDDTRHVARSVSEHVSTLLSVCSCFLAHSSQQQQQIAEGSSTSMMRIPLDHIYAREDRGFDEE